MSSRQTWSGGAMAAAVLVLAVLPSARPQGAEKGSGPPTPPGSLEQTVSELKARVAVLEQGTARLTKEVEGNASPVPARGAYDDHQEAAPRPNDLTLDPKYRGFIPVPNTEVMIKFNAKPRVDFTCDPQNTGNDDRFVPADIPVKGAPARGGGARFNANGKGSQLSVDVRAPRIAGSPRFYYQNDFFGSGGGNFPYHLQHMYGQYFNLIAGQTYSVWEDPDVYPDTVDSEGPNAAISGRRPLARYRLPLDDAWHLNFGVEKPDASADGASETIHPAPDCAFSARWERTGQGHAQLSSILRLIAARDAVGEKQTILGWGLNGGIGLDITGNDLLQGLLVYGAGIGSLGNDTGFLSAADAAYDADGDLRALKYFSALAGFTHHWSEKLRSTISCGYVNLGNEEAQDGGAYHRTWYASANLVYQIIRRMSVGLEGLYGYKQTKDGSSGDAWRAQIGLAYSIFD